MIFSKFTISKLGCDFSKYQPDCLVQIFAQVFEIDFFSKPALNLMPPDFDQIINRNPLQVLFFC